MEEACLLHLKGDRWVVCVRFAQHWSRQWHGTGLDESLQWPADPFVTSCPFSLGEPFFAWLEAHLPWDQTRDTSIMRQVGCRRAGEVPVGVCVTVHVRMNTWFIIKPWKSVTVTWHREIVASTLCSSSWPGSASLPRDKHHFTSAGDHIAAPNYLLPKLDVFLNIGGTVNPSKALAHL